jgi:hypothetical protein
MKKNMKGGGDPDPVQVQEGVQYLSLGDVVTGAVIDGVGLKVDPESIENLRKFTNNPVAVEQVKDSVLEVTNEIIAPAFSNTIDQLTPKLNQNIDQLKKAAVSVPLSAIPFVPTLIATSNAATAGLDTFTTASTALKDTIENVQDKLESTQNAVVNKVALPIESLENSMAISKPFNGTGGGRILSRIQKSVKNFMGKSKKITHKNTNTKINKKRSMKGGTYNKNKKRVFSQKGGQILSRINESLKIFNRM